MMTEIRVLIPNRSEQRQILSIQGAMHPCTSENALQAAVNPGSSTNRGNDNHIGIANPVSIECCELFDAVSLEHRLVAIDEFVANIRVLVCSENVYLRFGDSFSLPGSIN
jgi:hypothetical protein